MGLMTYFSSFLASQSSLSSTSSIRSFTVQVWLDESPLNHQFVSWYPIFDPNKPGQGYFGIPIRAPAEPLPVEDRAVFTIDSASPGTLSFSNGSFQSGSENKSNLVFVQQSGEVEYGAELPIEFFKPYTGNFSTVDFKHWPDLETIHALVFTPPELIVGMFLACPRELGKGKEKGYRLMAMTRMFRHPGCITLDWLVQTDIKKEMIEGGESDLTRDYRGL
ncbi:hypothetical protein BKA65DRAFT_491418 [Rhexocercosporidium sp. MPI-PUGE-AT-0058]|nr:hypothetical protein BKA65DRAFT_491418 [Rhexocercosporidium sp. MPI-PUGE-AT-0058]